MLVELDRLLPRVVARGLDRQRRSDSRRPTRARGSACEGRFYVDPGTAIRCTRRLVSNCSKLLSIVLPSGAWPGLLELACGRSGRFFTRTLETLPYPPAMKLSHLFTLPLALSLLVLPACDKKEDKKEDKKADKKAVEKGDDKTNKLDDEDDDKAAKEVEEPEAEEPDAEEPE